MALAKAEVGIRDKKPVPTVREFIDNVLAPFVEPRFASKAKTLEYSRIGLKNLREFEPLANSLLDAITGDKIASFIAKPRPDLPSPASIAGLSVSCFAAGDSVPSGRPFGASPLYSSWKASSSWFFCR